MATTMSPGASNAANRPSRNKKFFNWMVANGFTKPGAVVTMAQVIKALGISIPECMTPEDCKRLSLSLLGPIGYTRDTLLTLGLYFGQLNGDFRVMSLKDTSIAILKYATKAKNAALRGSTLNAGLNVKYNPHKAANHKAFVTAIRHLDKVKK